MPQESFEQRLDRIDTRWSLICNAHRGGTEAGDAQLRLLQRYGSAISRYLLGAVRDAQAAEELEQEFALRFIRGDFKAANPTKGRFRDYLRTVLSNLVSHYHGKLKDQPRQLAEDAPEPADPFAPTPEGEEDFVTVWRRELIRKAMVGLEDLQKTSGQPYYDLLQLRAADPDNEATSAQIAAELSLRLGRRFTADGVRKALQRSREKFAELLLDEVRASLGQPSHEELMHELRELSLMTACRPALDRRR